METIISLFAFICVVAAIYAGILMFRNFAVNRFCNDVNEQAFHVVMSFLNSIAAEEYTTEYHDKHVELLDMWQTIAEKRLNYDKMLFKFWVPLKQRYWLTDKEIEFLNSNYAINES